MRCTSGEGGDGEDGGEAAIRDGCGEAASAVEAALRGAWPRATTWAELHNFGEAGSEARFTDDRSD